MTCIEKMLVHSLANWAHIGSGRHHLSILCYMYLPCFVWVPVFGYKYMYATNLWHSCSSLGIVSSAENEWFSRYSAQDLWCALLALAC